jgi:hypothetical protein
MKFANSLEINEPIEKVFTFFSQPENLPKWNYYIRSVERTTPDISGVGAQFHQVRQSDELKKCAFGMCARKLVGYSLMLEGGGILKIDYFEEVLTNCRSYETDFYLLNIIPLLHFILSIG